jgi:hypothetical protein
MRGVYRHCNQKHLHRYLAEFDHRHNHRVALGYSDIDRITLSEPNAPSAALISCAPFLPIQLELPPWGDDGE